MVESRRCWPRGDACSIIRRPSGHALLRLDNHCKIMCAGQRSQRPSLEQMALGCSLRNRYPFRSPCLSHPLRSLHRDSLHALRPSRAGKRGHNGMFRPGFILPSSKVSRLPGLPCSGARSRGAEALQVAERRNLSLPGGFCWPALSPRKAFVERDGVRPASVSFERFLLLGPSPVLPPGSAMRLAPAELAPTQGQGLLAFWFHFSWGHGITLWCPAFSILTVQHSGQASRPNHSPAPVASGRSFTVTRTSSPLHFR